MLRRRFLIVTANEERARALAALVAGKDIATVRAATLAEALTRLGEDSHAAVFIDADGRELCRRLRAVLPPGSCALILFGSPRGRDSIVAGLDEGADDYWTTPFNEPVCQAYLRAILRRVSLLGASGTALKAGDLEVDPAARRALLAGRPVDLRSREFDLLYLLLKQRGKVLSRDYLMETAWGREYLGTTRTIDFHVSRLRHKLGRSGRSIETVAGEGYRFTDE